MPYFMTGAEHYSAACRRMGRWRFVDAHAPLDIIVPPAAAWGGGD